MGPKINKVVFSDNMKLNPGIKNENYTYLSNHYVCTMMIDNKEYNHVEGFFHSSKYKDTNEKLADRIRCILSPQMCKRLADNNPIDEIECTKWEQGLKIIIMKRGVFAKFITNSVLAKSLLQTQDKKLIYKSTDKYWGNGTDDSGKNNLGRILEEVRDILNGLSDIESDSESDT